jgi:hypothetical protein
MLPSVSPYNQRKNCIEANPKYVCSKMQPWKIGLSCPLFMKTWFANAFTSFKISEHKIHGRMGGFRV